MQVAWQTRLAIRPLNLPEKFLVVVDFFVAHKRG